MNSTGRISLLSGALVLLIFGIVCLRQQLSPGPSPPAFVSPGSAASNVGQREPSGYQPTILSAEPSSDPDLNVSPRLHEVSPVRPDETQLTPLGFPFNTTRSEGQHEGSLARADSQYTAPLSRDAPQAYTAAVLRAPPEIDTHGTDMALPEAAPPSVATVSEDSLWKISERVYRRGNFYKALFLHNRSVLPRPDQITAGIVITTPSLEELRRLYPNACPPAADTSDLLE